MNTALDIVFKVESPKGISGLALLLRARLVSIGLLMGFGFLLVVSLVLDTAIQTVGHLVLGSITVIVVAAVTQIFGLVVMKAGFGALIKRLPDVHVRFKNALVGGARGGAVFRGKTSPRALFSTRWDRGFLRSGRVSGRPHDVAVLLSRGVSRWRRSDRDT